MCRAVQQILGNPYKKRGQALRREGGGLVQGTRGPRLRHSSHHPRLPPRKTRNKESLSVAAAEVTNVSLGRTAHKALRAVFWLWDTQGPRPLLKGLTGRGGERQVTLQLAPPPHTHPFGEPSVQAGSPAPSGSGSEIAVTKVPPLPESGFLKNA